MCEPTLIIAAAQAALQYKQSRDQASAVKQTAANQQKVYEYNAKVAEANAEIYKEASHDALVRGTQSAAKIRENARKAIATQRATAGGSGLIVDTGTNLSLMAQNAGVGEMNALNEFNNYEREAYGFSMQEANQLNQANNLRYQGDLAVATASAQSKSIKKAGLLSAATTLVTGAANSGMFSSTGTQAAFNSMGFTSSSAMTDSQWSSFLAAN